MLFPHNFLSLVSVVNICFLLCSSASICVHLRLKRFFSTSACQQYLRFDSLFFRETNPVGWGFSGLI